MKDRIFNPRLLLTFSLWRANLRFAFSPIRDRRSWSTNSKL